MLLLWRSRTGRALPPRLDGEIMVFNRQLREGLETMAGRIRERSRELAAERDAMKSRLRLIQRKRKGARGYRPRVTSHVLMNSEA